ncbi:proto-oncogene serine/threonine-protein kinase mos [Scleropages formosus]|uniref:non-specific serine/threonine protein kinase n=1 Tax=Scleropages formosus TaxID=113540 RepID=A0A8C9W9L7_SCLFO|nr:proto-oncogene serine/threonine-protein kinase mos [Scleropages formosus]
MPSPIPVSRLLPPRALGPYLHLGACSSPMAKRHGQENALRVPERAPLDEPAPWPHKKAAWSSAVNWQELRALRPIGSGGFGSVYEARYYGETVAVKKVKRSARNRLASRRSFWSELNAAHLRHENIVRIIAATTCAPASEDSVGTIVMEYAGSVSLQSLIYCAAEELRVDRCLKYAKDIARGLCFLHAHCIAHLDLKPANVLVAPDDVCKIVDFGCSQKLEPAEHVSPATPHIGGTYTHRAPELLRGQEVTLKADVYSFAITFWQLLTRDEPYEGDRQPVLYAVVAFNLRPALTGDFFKSGLGRRCEALLGRCWHGDPGRRPCSNELLGELEILHLSATKVT